jgi:gliding motility-associated-like protein
VLQSDKYNSAYGLEFSPDGSKLYINASFTPTAKIYQIDLTSKAVTLVGTSASSYAGSMQLAPDGKIYFSRYESKYLGVINFPNEPGTDCGYMDNGFYLEGRVAAFGLPNFIQSWFFQPSFSFTTGCFSDPTFFSITDTNNVQKVEWIFNDPALGVINMSGLKNPSHIFSRSGDYDIVLSISYKDGTVRKTTGRVHIPDAPQVELGKDISLCAGQTTTLQANSPGSRYSWQDGSTEATYSVTKPGIYWVDVFSNGCIARDSVTVSYDSLPPVELYQAKDTTLCAGSTLMLTVERPVDNTRYSWQDGSAGTSFLVQHPGIYWIEASNSCGKTRDSVRVSYTAPISAFSLGQDTILKIGETLLLEVPVINAAYLWQDGSSQHTLLAQKPGIYWLEVTSTCETRRDSITIGYKAPAVKEVIVDTTICQGETIKLKSPGAFHSFQWQDGSTESSFTVHNSGTYWVQTIERQVITRIVYRVTYKQAPQVELGENTTLCGSEQLILNARQTDAKATYLWQDGSTEATYMATRAGKYWVEVTNSCGTVRDSIFIECPECHLEEMPNVITPNHDGANDSFSFKCINEKIWQIEIYNRWGKLVFNSKNYRGEWDASNLDNGMYYYTLRSPVSPTQYKGVVHVLR